eukprot:Clim_evm145s147 gene=Clim_evmTU145s147
MSERARSPNAAATSATVAVQVRSGSKLQRSNDQKQVTKTIETENLPKGRLATDYVGKYGAAFAGAAAGVVSRVATAPFDVIKIRLQLQLEPLHAFGHKTVPAQRYYHGVLHATRKIYLEEGVTAFWKGNVSAMAMYALYGGVQFAVYHELRQLILPRLKNENQFRRLGIKESYFCGGVAGAAATVASYPLDVLRTRFAGQGNDLVYRGYYQAVREMIRADGMRSFYRGVTPAVVQIFPYMGFQFMFFNMAKNLAEAGDRNLGFQWSEPAQNLVAGAAAGASAKAIMMPFDVVKKRLQVQGFEAARAHFGRTQRYTGLLNCIIFIFKQEGIPGFFKGTAASVIKSALASATTFAVYEECNRILAAHHHANEQGG